MSDRPVIRFAPATGVVLADVAAERGRAEQKFPGQHLPDGTPFAADRLGHDTALDQARRTRDMYRRVTEKRTARGALTWADVLREEVYEALAEEDPAALRAELIQVAQVAVRWVEDIDLRTRTEERA